MMNFIANILGLSEKVDSEEKLEWNAIQKWLAFFLISFGTYHWMIDGRVGFGIFKLILMISMVLLLPFSTVGYSKAFLLGTLYIGWQWFVSSLHPESWRWSTLLFSAGLCYMYVSFYNFVCIRRVLTIFHYLKIIQWMMLAYFWFCILQQGCLLLGIKTLPLLNHYYLGRGIGCYSLSMEPSTFARFMLVCYYCYIKSHELLRGKGRFTLKELFQGEHKWVTLRFLWMMTTMGSGTAYGCLVLLSLYFVTLRNFFYVLPILLVCYFGISMLEIEQFNRAASVINATVLQNEKAIALADGSGMSRISPLINSFKADFSDLDTWFGHGIDYARKLNLVITQKATMFDDYGIIWLIIGYIFTFSCSHMINDISAIFMLVGFAGCCIGNIHYSWELAMIMTCLREYCKNGILYNTDYDMCKKHLRNSC